MSVSCQFLSLLCNTSEAWALLPADAVPCCWHKFNIFTSLVIRLLQELWFWPDLSSSGTDFGRKIATVYSNYQVMATIYNQNPNQKSELNSIEVDEVPEVPVWIKPTNLIRELDLEVVLKSLDLQSAVLGSNLNSETPRLLLPYRGSCGQREASSPMDEPW